MEHQKRDRSAAVLRDVLKDLSRKSDGFKKSCRIELDAGAVVALSIAANRKALAAMVIAKLRNRYPRRSELAGAVDRMSLSCQPSIALAAFLEFRILEKERAA